MSEIYFKDSIVGSFKYSSAALNPLIIYNNIRYQFSFDPKIDNTYSILFKINSLNIKSGVLQKYILSRRTMLDGESQFGNWEVILEKDSYSDSGYFEETSFNIISNSNFTVDNNKYQFKIDFYDLNNIIGSLTTSSTLTNTTIQDADPIENELIPAVNYFSVTLMDSTAPLAAGNIINLPVIGDNLTVYKKDKNKYSISLYPANSNGKLTLPSNFTSQLSGYSNTELKTPATILLTDNNRQFFTISKLQFYGSIYQVPFVKYNEDFEPESLSYREYSHLLTTTKIDLNFSLPIDATFFGYTEVEPPYTSQIYSNNIESIEFKNIKNEPVTMSFNYLHNTFYKSSFIKVYIFIPNIKDDQDAIVDSNPLANSQNGKWYFKEQQKLSDLEIIGTFSENKSNGADETYQYRYNTHKMSLYNLPKNGDVFYIWLGIGFQNPYDLLKQEYSDIASIPIWQ